MILRDNINTKNENELRHHLYKTERLLSNDNINLKKEFYKEKDREHQWFTIFKMLDLQMNMFF